jgi:predicted nucleic acid-binding protein
MTDGLWISNASPLIALTQIDRLWILPALIAEVAVPPAVRREIAPTLPQPPAWLVERPSPAQVHAEVEQAGLDEGEAEALNLALDLGAAGILLDDLKARKLAARLGFEVVGTLGVLLLAKQRSLLSAIRPDFDALARVRFHFSSKVADTILAKAGEGSARDPTSGR